MRSGCGPQAADEIVVCGAGEQRSIYRLPEISPDYGQAPAAPPRAATQIAPGVQGSINVQSVDLPGGVKSQRLMLTVGTKF